jgi:short-subunit dehydrogenase
MNKLIVITGGTRGIGRAIAEKFASKGFDLVVSARTKKDLDVLQGQLETQYKIKVMTHSVDMTKKDEVKSFCHAIVGLNRSVDVLVNNAGYFLPGEIAAEPEGTLESMIEANLYSAYYTTRGIVPVMKEHRDGHIFNMCSIASIRAYPNGGSYAISKFALLGFSKCLREELKDQGIRVTSILPGATYTASWEGAGLPESRFIKAEDIADTVYSVYELSKHTVVEEILLRPQLGDI